MPANFFYKILIVPVVGLVTLVFWAGLDGSFVLDDYPNLSGLEVINNARIHGENSAQSAFIDYVFSGQASTLGRPVALLSFALQSNAWPLFPFELKFVNLVIHLINGCLITVLSFWLAGFASIPKSHRISFALTVAFMWMVSPLQVTTVTYVVQRMTSLSATFVLCGLLAYLWGRKKLYEQSRLSGYAWLFVGVPVFMGLAILTKENGILLSLYILCIEGTLLKSKSVNAPLWSLWKLGVWLPILALLIYLFSNVDARILGSYRIRDFNLPERLMTESRILWDYLRLILLPDGRDFSLFHDDIVISRGFTSPFTTIISCVSLGLVGLASFVFRRRVPVFSFAVVWYLVGHALESSFLGLELYFEHRNYLPMFGIWLAVIAGAWAAYRLVKQRLLRCVFIVGCVLYVAFISFVTQQQAALWGDPVKQAHNLIENNPDSIRTRAYLASLYEGTNHVEAAAMVSHTMIRDWPELTGGYFQLLYFHCINEKVPVLDTETVKTKVRAGNFDFATIGYLRKLVTLVNEGQCSGISAQQIIHLIEAVRENPKFKEDHRLLPLVASLFSGQGDYDSAAAIYFMLPRTPHFLLDQARYLATAGKYDMALELLIEAEMILNNDYRKQSKLKEVQLLRTAILLDKKSK